MRSLYIDELATSGQTNNRAIAYNTGVQIVDPLIPESDLIVEYTRIDPFVYFHSDQAQTYANYGYQLGHWIGSNADQVYLAFRKRIIRGLDASVSFSYIRKGDEPSYNKKPYQEDQKFLFGTRKDFRSVGLDVNYEILHSLNAKFSYRMTNIPAVEKTVLRGGDEELLSVGMYGL